MDYETNETVILNKSKITEKVTILFIFNLKNLSLIENFLEFN
jgi:hypothetical protein